MLFKRDLSLAVVVAIAALAGLACNASSTPVSTSAPPATQAPGQATATSPKPNTELATPVTPASPSESTAVTTVETNIRNGPGLDYDVLATLSTGLTIKLTGRNADKSWLQLEFAAGPDGRAWVFASNVKVSQGVNTDALPIVAVQPAPTRTPTNTPAATATTKPATATLKPVTATPRPPAATNTPASPAVFRADKTQLSAGECTLLRWDVDNVKAVFLDIGGGDQPVTGHDTRQVCLDSTATFTLHVVNNDDTSKKYSLTITVSGECGDTPIIVRFEAGATEIKAGHSTTLAWDVICAQSVFLKEGDKGREPVTGHEERTIEPDQTTTYRLIVVAKDGSEIKEDIKIKVVP